MKQIKKPKPGRPLLGAKKRERCSFTLSPAALTWLQQRSRKEKVSQSEVLEKILSQHALLQRLPLSVEKIAVFCKLHRIHKLSLFGSILDERFQPESDIDMLIEFEAGSTPSLFTLARLEQELSKKLGRKVDLRTPKELSHLFRDEVLEKAQILYAA